MCVKFYTQFSKLCVKSYTQRSSLNACNAEQRIRLIGYFIAQLRETGIGLFPRNRRGHFKQLCSFGKVQAEIRQLALTLISERLTTCIVASLKYELACSLASNFSLGSFRERAKLSRRIMRNSQINILRSPMPNEYPVHKL